MAAPRPPGGRDSLNFACVHHGHGFHACKDVCGRLGGRCAGASRAVGGWRQNAASYTSASRVSAARIAFSTNLHQKGPGLWSVSRALAACGTCVTTTLGRSWRCSRGWQRWSPASCGVRGPYVWPSGLGGAQRRPGAGGRWLSRPRLFRQGEAPGCPPLRSDMIKTPAVRLAGGGDSWCVVHCRRRRRRRRGAAPKCSTSPNY